MKTCMFLCLAIYLSPILKGQDYNDYAYSSRAVNIPAAQTYSATSIAGYVQSNFKTDLEKLGAIYTWVITNIRYDTDSMYPINWSLEREEKVSATLRRRRGVCENYAALFTEIAVKSGYPSFVVSGYTRLQGAFNNAGHSWSAVSFQGKWFLCDPTWDVGSHGNTRYFLVNPADFIETHIPFDPLWQLLEHPLMENEFRKGIRAKKDGNAFNLTDSVNAFLQLDSLQQLEASAKRIKQAGIENERQKNWLAYNQMKIAGIYGERDMELYNLAVSDLNKANDVFNKFVQYRNSQFTPARPDAEISALLDPIPGLVSAALKKLNQMGQGVANFQYDPTLIKDKLSSLSVRVKEQQVFVKHYLEVNAPDRSKLFYK